MPTLILPRFPEKHAAPRDTAKIKIEKKKNSNRATPIAAEHLTARGSQGVAVALELELEQAAGQMASQQQQVRLESEQAAGRASASRSVA